MNNNVISLIDYVEQNKNRISKMKCGALPVLTNHDPAKVISLVSPASELQGKTIIVKFVDEISTGPTGSFNLVSTDKPGGKLTITPLHHAADWSDNPKILPFERHTKKTLESLAYWFFGDDSDDTRGE